MINYSEEFVSAYDDLQKAIRDRSHLTQKVITDKNGHTRKVWVKTEVKDTMKTRKNETKNNTEKSDKGIKVFTSYINKFLPDFISKHIVDGHDFTFSPNRKVKTKIIDNSDNDTMNVKLIFNLDYYDKKYSYEYNFKKDFKDVDNKWFHDELCHQYAIKKVDNGKEERGDPMSKELERIFPSTFTVKLPWKVD